MGKRELIIFDSNAQIPKLTTKFHLKSKCGIPRSSSHGATQSYLWTNEWYLGSSPSVPDAPRP